jgi:hypothetical protein
MKLIGLSCFFLAISMFLVGGAFAEILFIDDFETGGIDAAKWDAAAAWQVIDADGPGLLGSFVLDCPGGEEALSVMEFPEEYDYYADFNSVNGLTGFIFQAQDTANLYMNQVSVTGSAHTPNHIRWHSKVAGGYAADPLAFADGVDREMGVWYRVKFEVRGASFSAYLGDAGAGMNDLSLVSEWTHADESFTSGKIGIRMSGSEHAMYDNITVVTPGSDPAGDGAAVDHHGKLAQTWGAIKK